MRTSNTDLPQFPIKRAQVHPAVLKDRAEATEVKRINANSIVDRDPEIADLAKRSNALRTKSRELALKSINAGLNINPLPRTTQSTERQAKARVIPFPRKLASTNHVEAQDVNRQAS